MLKKKSPGVFHRLTRLRSRCRQIRTEIIRISGAVRERDLKLQLSQARATLSELEEHLTPLPGHVDVPFGAAPPVPSA